MGGVLPCGQEAEPRPTRPAAGQGPRGSSIQATTTLTPGEDDYAVIVELDVTRLRRFQSRAKTWPRESDPYKPVPQGFVIAPRRREIPYDESSSTPYKE
jgi:hypothetical protein